MKKLYLLLISLFLVSCNNYNSKIYTYVEEELDLGTHSVEEKEQVFTEISDSAAFLNAYKKYLISKVARASATRASGAQFTELKGYKLLDENKNEITNTVIFDKKDSLMLDLEKTIGSLSIDNNTSSKTIKPKLNTEELEHLKKLFIYKKDEFDPDGLTWVTPKSAPKHVNENGIYCYFEAGQITSINLRFRLQYTSDEWLFMERCQFLIDGKAYEYTPINLKRDSGNGGEIWEWFDDSVDSSNKDIIIALSQAKTAKVKIKGNQYFDIVKITTKQLKTIKNTLDLYESTGGTFKL